MPTVTVKPRQEFVCADADAHAALKVYLDGLDYKTTKTTYATRTDNDGSLTIVVQYPEWELKV